MMSNILEAEESNINQELFNEEQSSKEKAIYNTNSFPSGNTICSNPNSEIISIKTKNETSNLFPYYFSRQAIINSFLDQQKTIHLQSILKKAKIETIEFIVNELKGVYSDIIKDKNGNYFCSDLIKACEEKQRIKILKELSPKICEDCLNYFAHHTIEVLIERASSEIEFKYILSSFNNYNNFLSASLAPIGSYTIQKIIEYIPCQFRNEFNLIFVSFMGFISKKQFGILNVKKFIKNTKSENINLLIMDFIRKNFMNLAVNQYANYLIQFLLEIWKNTPEGNEIKEMVFKHFQEMCRKKYSSFICELFINIISTEEKIKLIKTLDLDYLLKSNNQHAIKIIKALGINNHNDNGTCKKDEADGNEFSKFYLLILTFSAYQQFYD